MSNTGMGQTNSKFVKRPSMAANHSCGCMGGNPQNMGSDKNMSKCTPSHGSKYFSGGFKPPSSGGSSTSYTSNLKSGSRFC